VWILPFVGLVGGAAGLYGVLRRWKKRSGAAPAPVEPAYVEQVRRDIARDQT
jgi:hypothetical protein